MSVAYLYGHPVSHSLSPAMHNAAFAALGLPHRYEAIDVPLDGVAGAVARLRGNGVLGANVTVPHKLAVMQHLDQVSPEARDIGAVNTIVRRDGASPLQLHGHNTDAHGFDAAWREADVAVTDDLVLLLGAGGAARAVLAALLARGNRVEIASRSVGPAQELARGRDRVSVVPWPKGAEWRWALVVNATPLGLHGEDPLEGLVLPASSRLFDLIPTAAQTPLVRRARAAGMLRVVDGLLMLLHQAARSFELWTGENAPVDAMRAALPRTDLVG